MEVCVIYAFTPLLFSFPIFNPAFRQIRISVGLKRLNVRLCAIN